jgi:hypothetical protein
MFDFQYRVTGRWTDERRGTVETEGVDTSISFSAPPEFQGETGFWTTRALLRRSDRILLCHYFQSYRRLLQI